MLPILRSFPFFPIRTIVEFGGRSVDIYPHQIVVWVGLTEIDQTDPPPVDCKFPAILDTGHSHNFAISPNHLRDWARIEWNQLPLERVERFHQGIPVPMRRANLWLYPNQSGWRDWIDPARLPILLPLDEGIAVFGNGVDVGTKATTQLVAHRLPVLGLRAIVTNRLHLHIDPVRRHVSLNQAES